MHGSGERVDCKYGPYPECRVVKSDGAILYGHVCWGSGNVVLCLPGNLPGAGSVPLYAGFTSSGTGVLSTAWGRTRSVHTQLMEKSAKTPKTLAAYTMRVPVLVNRCLITGVGGVGVH